MPTARDANRAALMTLAPELGLLAAVLQQVLHDTRSHRPDIRAEALQFLEDAEAVAWFGQQLGVEGALEHQVRAVLRDRR